MDGEGGPIAIAASYDGGGWSGIPNGGGGGKWLAAEKAGGFSFAEGKEGGLFVLAASWSRVETLAALLLAPVVLKEKSPT